MKATTISIAIAVFLTAGANICAYGQSSVGNSFFGNSIGGSQETQQGGGTIDDKGAAVPVPPAGEYSSDEKRMQRKYRDNIKSAQKLVSKAQEMIKSNDPKLSKKGQILKEIGDKRLAELKASNPFPEIAGKETRKLNQL